MQKMFLDFGVYIVLVYLGLIITHLALTWIVADPLGKYLKIKLLK
jgi:hypothetical protein